MKKRSNQSLINLLNRRERPENHLAKSLIYPDGSNWATGISCLCGNFHPLYKQQFKVNWDENTNTTILRTPEKIGMSGYVTGYEGIIESC